MIGLHQLNLTMSQEGRDLTYLFAFGCVRMRMRRAVQHSVGCGCEAAGLAPSRPGLSLGIQQISIQTPVPGDHAAKIDASSAPLSFARAWFWICLTRSLVTPMICPICSNVMATGC